MTIKHHPNPDTLVQLATGRLDPGRAIVVAAHVEMCAVCARDLRLMKCIGGVMLADEVPVPMTTGAMVRLIDRVDALSSLEPSAVDVTSPADLTFLPPAARLCQWGRWQWIGPGIHRRLMKTTETGDARVFLLRARQGTRMPEHTHSGSELTLVLRGSFAHEGGRFGPGDFEEADDEVEHQPVVEAGESCICLVAMDGGLKLKGLTGLLLQPFVKI